MTGIKRLRALAYKKNFLEPAEARELDHIADQIEREARDPAADVSMSAYDLLPADERDAIAWVREHGGIDYVKREWRSRVPYDLYERRRQRLLGHIAECETALGRRREIISKLGHRASDLTTENAELRRRAMPEGCEWPRYEDGEPVMLNDVALLANGLQEEVYQVHFHGSGFALYTETSYVDYSYGDRVRRPAPAVLAADGEPLEVGQTVYGVDDGIERKVYEIDTSKVTSVAVDRTSCGYVYRRPEGLTHQRPVLDADGVPIKKGDTVYLLPGEWCDVFPCSGFHGGEELEVFADGEASHVPGGVQCRETGKSLGSRGTCYPQPSQLTHTKPEPPDSWERIEEDATLGVNAYRERYGIEKHDGMTWPQLVREDLVRRCRALAERGE